MGSQRPTSPSPKDALDPVDTSRRRAYDAILDSDKTESASTDETTAEKNQQDSKENKLSFDPMSIASGSIDKILTLFEPESDKKSDKTGSENDLDFRPEADGKKRGFEIPRSNTVPYIDQPGASPTFFLLKENESKDKPAPEIEIVQGTSLQISDESGNIIADSQDRTSNFTIRRDPVTGDITSILYPDGKARNFTYTNGKLTGIETLETSKDGKVSQTKLVKENGQWFADLSGVKAALPGEIKLSKFGVLSFQLDENGKWRQERPDGKTLIEKSIASGARLAYDADDNIRQVNRTNESSCELNYRNGLLSEVIEIDKDGNKVTWSKTSGDKWVSDTNPPSKRLKMGIFPNGNLTYTEENGVKKVVTTTGSEIEVRPDGSTYEFDRQGRFTAVRHSNGLEVNDLKYNDDGRLTNVRMTGKDGKTLHFERNGDKDSWKLTTIEGATKTVTERDWKGDIKISENGTYSYRDDNAIAKNEHGLWTVYNPDGTKVYVKENPDGSSATLSLEKNILNIERTNGTGLDVKYTNGHITEFTTRELNGDTVKYSYDASKAQFIPDKPGYKNIAEIYTRQDGSVELFDETGTRFLINLDGSQSVENKNGSTAQVNSKGQVTSTTSKKGEIERSFTYGADGKLRSVHETRKVDDKVQTREITGNDLTVSKNGTIKFTDSSGKKISTTADGSWQTLDGEGRIISVSVGNQTRDFVRNAKGEITKIVDTKTAKGVSKSEEWSRLLGSDTFTKPGKDSDLIERREVKVLDDGSYRYIDEAGKEKFARVGYHGLDSGFSGSVEEARERLTELMEGHLDEPRKQRLDIIFDRYEKRAENRIEAQVAAGQDPEKCRLEWDEKVTKSYDNLAKMLDPNANTVYDLGVRAKLVESMAFTLACPVKANDQGNWGCCWMISGVFCGIIQHPDKMTDMLQQLSTTGSYTDLEGKTWTPPKGLLSITDQGGRWTIDNCGGGHRSPVSEILTSVAAYLSEDGRRTDRGSRGGTPSAMNHAMKKITGDTWTVTSEQSSITPKMQKELLEKGGYVCIYPGHMYLAALEKHGEEWLVVASLQHGDGGRRINGTVSDLKTWNITGGRRRYNPDINLPECQDSPTGPIGNNWPGGGGTRNWPFPGPFRPDPWPLLDRFPFIFRLYDETTRRKEKEREKEKEEERKKKEQERIEEERELAEKRAEDRRIHKEQQLLEKQIEEEKQRAKKQDEEARKKAEALKKKQRVALLKHQERYRKLMAKNQARAIESSNEFAKRSNKQDNKQPTNLSGQFIDNSKSQNSSQSNEQTPMPSTINGFKIAHRPGASELANRVELVSPFQESSPELKATLAKENIPVTSNNLNTPSWIDGLKLIEKPGDSSLDTRLELISPLSQTTPELEASLDKEPSSNSSES